MRKRYHYVLVTEGGADFEDYWDPNEVPITVNQWYNAKDNGAAVRKELIEAEIGDEIQLDGCATCYVLKERK